MRDDPIAVLERELVDAARRQARGGSARRSQVGRIASGLLIAAVLAVTLLIAGGALILLGGHRRAATPAAATVPGRQQLVDILGVLRRPQTKADLASPQVKRILERFRQGTVAMFPVFRGSPDISLIRLATVTPWGETVFVIPLKPPSAQALARMRRQHPGFPRRFFTGPALKQESMFFAGGCCATAGQISRYGDGIIEGAGRAFAGGARYMRFIELVPDGVSSVKFLAPGHPVTVQVHGNVAAVQVKGGCCAGPAPMVWYAADGRVLRRVGSALPVVRAPRPAPETALSRAAERDPSTPNPVWVTPRVGGPHTNFQVHFRVLLSDADYGYRLTGTSCPRVTMNGGDGGGTNDVRGRIWSDSVDAVQGQTWCPGTYHLSASVMDLGRHGTLKRYGTRKHPARPFGSATFVVR